jgi:hypothetical protein
MNAGKDHPAVINLVARLLRGEAPLPSRNRNFDAYKKDPTRSAVRIYRRLKQVEARLAEAAHSNGDWELTLIQELESAKRLDFFRRDGSARHQVRVSDAEWDLLVLRADADPEVRALVEDAVIDASLRAQEARAQEAH